MGPYELIEQRQPLLSKLQWHAPPPPSHGLSLAGWLKPRLVSRTHNRGSPGYRPHCDPPTPQAIAPTVTLLLPAFDPCRVIQSTQCCGTRASPISTVSKFGP